MIQPPPPRMILSDLELLETKEMLGALLRMLRLGCALGLVVGVVLLATLCVVIWRLVQ